MVESEFNFETSEKKTNGLPAARGREEAESYNVLKTGI